MATSNEIKYPVGIQSFSEIRERGFLYVDKTAFIHELKKGKYYFLSRPRRFGKSLLLSTLEAYYRGRRDLFKGLSIDSLTDEWDPHPVIHIDLNNGLYQDAGSLVNTLAYKLSEYEKLYGVDEVALTVHERFATVIRAAFEATGKKVVILVDEYDKPMLNVIASEELVDLYRDQLKAFYSNLKTMDPYIEIAMLTGVARFSKVSIFSDLNNLRDISFEENFASICGITSGELDQYFADGINLLAERNAISAEEVRSLLKKNYDGYHFSPDSPDIYNPFSLVNTFAKLKFGHYWFDSGTPSFLVKMIQREEWKLDDISPVEVDADNLQSAGIMSMNPVLTLYFSGYLTIKEYDSFLNTYTLEYPNEEVRQGFLKFLIPYYVYPPSRPGVFLIGRFLKEVNSGDAEGFMSRLETMIAGVPYSEKGSAEAHFQNAMYLLFNLLGFYTSMEYRTSSGRIDLKVETDRYIYIFEFKVNSTSMAAMEQIKEKKYWLPYSMSGKDIILIGSNFNTETRTLDSPVIEIVPAD